MAVTGLLGGRRRRGAATPSATPSSLSTLSGEDTPLDDGGGKLKHQIEMNFEWLVFKGLFFDGGDTEAEGSPSTIRGKIRSKLLDHINRSFGEENARRLAMDMMPRWLPGGDKFKVYVQQIIRKHGSGRVALVDDNPEPWLTVLDEVQAVR